MNLVEVLEGRCQLSEHGGSVSEVHPALVVPPERVDEALATPLLCGLQTGVVIGCRPKDRAIRLVSCAM